MKFMLRSPNRVGPSGKVGGGTLSCKFQQEVRYEKGTKLLRLKFFWNLLAEFQTSYVRCQKLRCLWALGAIELGFWRI